MTAGEEENLTQYFNKNSSGVFHIQGLKMFLGGQSAQISFTVNFKTPVQFSYENGTGTLESTVKSLIKNNMNNIIPYIGDPPTIMENETFLEFLDQTAIYGDIVAII